jgi:hypothetical protein
LLSTKIDEILVSPLLAECMGLRWCLAWAFEKQLSNFTIRLDAETDVKRLYVAPLIAEIEPVYMQVIPQPMWNFLKHPLAPSAIGFEARI